MPQEDPEVCEECWDNPCSCEECEKCGEIEDECICANEEKE